MQALVLVGGEGTRLRPLTETLPKPALPLVGRPFISYMIDWLARYGVSEVVLASGFLADQLRAVLGDGGEAGPRLTYLTEPEARGTAGAIRFAAEILDERFLALNGDILCDLDLGELLRVHDERGARATLALHPVADPTGYGLVSTDASGAITEFLEKPEAGHAGGGDINAGAYVLERSVLDLIPPDTAVSIEREVFPELIGNGLGAVSLDGYWIDLGTPDRYLQASWDILERRVDTVLSERLDAEGLLVEPGAEIAPGANVIAPAVIGTGARVEAGATVGPRAVVGSGSSIGAGATLTGSVLHPGCTIGADAEISGAILAARAEVAPGAGVGPGQIVAADQLVGAQ